MEGTDLLSGGIEELTKMATDLGNRDICCNQVNVKANEGKKLEKELKQEIESLNKELEDRVNSERIMATQEEDKIIKDSSRSLKEIRNERNKAKDKGIKDRIEKEISEYVEENRDLHRTIRKSFKENGIPAYCDTKWFYAIYCTQGGIEWLIKILLFLSGLVIVPGIVVMLVNPWWFVKIILWIFTAIIFIVVYMTIYLLTKDKDSGILEDMRLSRYKISDNEKQIKKIKKKIKNDNDESHYDLETFNEKISELEKGISDANNVKTEKLKDFEENKKQHIVDEINKKHNIVIENKKKEISDKKVEYEKAIEKSNEEANLIANTYEQVLTKQYSTKDAAQKMINIINDGKAQNIGEALQILKH